MELVERFFKNEVEEKELARIRSYFNTLAEHLMLKGEEYFTAGYAGFACVSAANNALYGFFELDFAGKPEIETDPDLWTAAFLASIAYCGGATWEKGVGDDLKRREFWEWFLDEAVPSLWVCET